MFSTGLSKSYLGDAVLTGAYLINRMPSSVLDYKSPIELLMDTTVKHLIHLTYLDVCFIHDHGKSRGKLDPKALNCVFISYLATKKGYKCYHPSTRQIFISVDVTFREDESFFSLLFRGGVLRKNGFPYHYQTMACL